MTQNKDKVKERDYGVIFRVGLYLGSFASMVIGFYLVVSVSPIWVTILGMVLSCSPLFTLGLYLVIKW